MDPKHHYGLKKKDLMPDSYELEMKDECVLKADIFHNKKHRQNEITRETNALDTKNSGGQAFDGDELFFLDDLG